MGTPNLFPPSRILCVGIDDNLCSRLNLKLKDLGYQITSVATFADALHKINTETFDQYILAGILSDGSCLNLCKLIRQTDSETPIIFYSRNHSPEVVKKALQVGANAYFNKFDDLEF